VWWDGNTENLPILGTVVYEKNTTIANLGEGLCYPMFLYHETSFFIGTGLSSDLLS
jgi:hypothetical protein